MKKIIAILTPLFLFATVAAKAEIGIGVTGALHMFDGSGTETTRTSAQKNTGSHTHDVLVPEIFVEAIGDTGFTLGLSFIPTREMGSKSRSDTNSAGDTGTYTAKAELTNVVQVYTDIPLGSYPVHLKLGVQHVTLATLESLNSGSTYPDEDLIGFTVGIGTKGDLPYGNNLYYKLEATYTEFEDYKADSSSTAPNTLEASFDDTAAKLSVGYKF
jgi:opacity protein-like surface antigen